MLKPGSSTKSAMTRFHNDQQQGKRMTMPMNKAAQASLRHQTSESNPAGPPVGNPQSDPLAGFEPPTSAPVELPAGGPQGPPVEDEGFDPAVFKEGMLDTLVGQVRTEKFLNSPRVKDGVTSIQVREFFNRSNPNAMPDQRDLMTKVMARMKMRPE